MSHERDHDHPPVPANPRPPDALESKRKPDCKRSEHPTPVPREPIDPKVHPNRRGVMLRARPA